MHKVRVRVILKGGLVAPVEPGADEFTLDLSLGATLADVLNRLSIPHHEVMGAASGSKLKRLSDPVEDGEILEILPVISGG